MDLPARWDQCLCISVFAGQSGQVVIWLGSWGGERGADKLKRSSGLSGTFPEGEQFLENRGQSGAQCLSTMSKNGEGRAREQGILYLTKCLQQLMIIYGIDFSSKMAFKRWGHWKCSRSWSKYECVNQMWYVGAIEHDSAFKKQKTVFIRLTWINLTNSPKQIRNIIRFSLQEVTWTVTFIETEGRMVVPGDWRGEWLRKSQCSVDIEFQFGKMKKLWRWILVMVAQWCECT